jgi:hypothetical protein
MRTPACRRAALGFLAALGVIVARQARPPPGRTPKTWLYPQLAVHPQTDQSTWVFEYLFDKIDSWVS